MNARRLTALVLLVSGCGYAPTRLKPGSDVAVPERVGAGEAVLRTLACTAKGGDSLQKKPEAAGQAQIRTSCGGVRDTIKR
jgi:hypothetical protein